MKIICVCGMGLGSSLILRINVEKALSGLKIQDIQVDVADIGTARGSGADIIVSSHQFCEGLKDMNVPMIEIINYTDVPHIENELKKILNI